MTTAPAGIPCPRDGCGHTRSRVVATRHRGGRVVRLRRCRRCDHQFRTDERLSHASPRRNRRTDL